MALTNLTGTIANVGDAIALAVNYNGYIEVNLASHAMVGANVVFEVTVDGTNWNLVSVYPYSAQTGYGAPITSTTVGGNYTYTISGSPAQFRVRLTAITSGNFAVTMTPVGGAVEVGGGSVIVTPGNGSTNISGELPGINIDGGALVHVTNWPSNLGGGESSSVSVSNFPSVQPVSASALPLPSGAAVAALQSSINADGGSLSHVTNFPATQVVSATALPLPTGASTSALQTAANTSLSTLAANSATLGQKASAGSAPVVLASDQVLPLPTGASTSALQTAANTSLATIATNTPAVGQKTAANSSPVVLASDQTLPLPTGAATSALQTTTNTSLATIATNTAGLATVANQTTANTSLATIATNTASLATAANQATAQTTLTNIQNNTAAISTGQGTDAAGVTQPTGGAGVRGWLSGIYQALINTLSVKISSAFTPTVNSAGGTLSTANTDATILAANATRRFLMIQNTHATASLTISLNGGATMVAGAPNMILAAGATLILDVAVPSTAIHAQSATAGATYSILEG